jgi:DNA-binding CsgD family transcriptional regulator/GTPase SAR1 family protein
VAARGGETGPALVGRASELSVVRDGLDRAEAGAAVTILVTGDAGVGKTALVRQACDDRAAETIVLMGGCLPLTSMAVPFLAFRSALRDIRGREIASAPHFLEPGQPAENVPLLLDGWLDDVCAINPVVLVIDDLQWADQSTLDALMYLVAGPRARRLAVVATVRSSDIGEDHPLRHWLADIQRMPGTEELRLGNLDRIATGQQISNILGRPAHESLIDDVYARTLGNAYLTRLLVSGLAADAHEVESDLNPDLAGAVLRSWTRLSAPARRLTRIMAIGGGPMTAALLSRITGDSEEQVRGLLREAADAGAVDPTADGRYWFHHPLIAEALHQTTPVDERRELHAAFADDLEAAHDTDSDAPVETVVAIADHRFEAAQLGEALTWAVRAADSARTAGGQTEMLRLLTRALRLEELVEGSPFTRRELLERLVSAADLAGKNAEELGAINLLLDHVESTREPLRVAELLVRRAHLRYSTGATFSAVAEYREAVALAAQSPDSWQYAYALACLAWAEYWNDDPHVAEHAESAVAAATRADDVRAMAYALYSKALGEYVRENGEASVALAERSAEAAREARDPWAFSRASLLQANALEMWTSRRFAELIRRRQDQASEFGAPHSYIALFAAVEASAWVAIGEWEEGLRSLRVALGASPGELADIQARLAAARLAAARGRVREARGHLNRAEEIVQDASAFRANEFDAVRAIVCLAENRPAEAFEAAMTGLLAEGVPPTMCEWLLPLAARSLADQAEAARDRGRDPGEFLEAADSLVRRFPEIVKDVGEPTELWNRQIGALADWYAAEIARAERAPNASELWRRTLAACQGCQLAWEEAYAYWRYAEALLVDGSGDRAAAAEALRRGIQRATQLGAVPEQDAMKALAVTARIPLAEVTHSISASDSLTASLTPRERTILQYIVAGRTYGEIARELFISDKTVSSHVSSLLRKSGARNRVELALLASRSLDETHDAMLGGYRGGHGG